MSDESGTPTDVIGRLNIPWVESPFFDTLLEQSPLDEQTKALVRQYSEDGYLLIDPQLDNFDVLAGRIIGDVAEGMKDDSREFGAVGRVMDAWKFSENVKTLAVAPYVMSLLETLYRRRPVPFQTLNFAVGTEQRTHSDTIHFHSAPARFMCGVWVALEDIDENCGPLHYYPGSHKLPLFDLHDIGVSVDPYESGNKYPFYEEFVERLMETKGLQRVEVTPRKGQALIWSANLFHGGSPIREPGRTRHSQVTHYYFSGCRYYIPAASDPFLERIHWKQVVNIATGEMEPHFYDGQLVEESKPQTVAGLIKGQLLHKLKQYPIGRRMADARRRMFPRPSK